MLTVIRKHDGGLSASEDLQKKLEAYQDFYDKATERRRHLKGRSGRYWSEACHRIGRQYYRHGDYTAAAKHAAKSVKHVPRPRNFSATAVHTAKLVADRVT